MQPRAVNTHRGLDSLAGTLARTRTCYPLTHARADSSDDPPPLSWYPIRDKSTAVTGHVMFGLSVNGSGTRAEAGGVLPEVSLESLESNMDSLESGGADDGGLVTGIKVVVAGGRGMPKMDSGFFAWMGGGKCDPYLKITCGEETVQTQVCKRTLTPAWNETLSLKLPPRAAVDGAELVVEAYDHDLVRDSWPCLACLQSAM